MSEDDYDFEESNRNKKRKGMSASAFVIDEAMEDDDDEEDEFDEYDEDEGDVLGERIDNEPMVDRSSLRREGNRFMNQLETIDERAITERYKNYGNEINTSLQDTPEEALRPTKQDSPLWLVRCKPGKEKDCVLQLMQLHFARLELGKPIAIISAIACENISGFIYVEARNRNAVKDSIEEVTNIFPFQLDLVPFEEMTDVLKSQKQKPLINAGEWVRVTKGLYKGDIGKVIEAEDPNKIFVKLIPRIDLEELEQPKEASAKKRKKFNFSNRPKAMLMNVKDQSGNKDIFDYKGHLFDRNGFLYKHINHRSLKYNDVTPTLDELQMFNQSADDFSSEEEDKEDDFGESRKNKEEKKRQINHKNLSLDIQNMKKKKRNFLKGETVIVTSGEYLTMKGKVETVSGEIVTVRLFDFSDRLLRFSDDELEKFFQTGDHVKVLEGKHKGETGLIIKVEENIVYILSDENKLNQIVVLKNDIQESTEVSVGKLKLGNYNLHDLVKIQGTRNVGVVIKIETDSFRLLDNTGLIKVLRLAEMGQKMKIKDATSFDKNANQISVDDTVKIEDGKYKGRTGKVVHIFRFYIFLKSSEITENFGWAAIKTDHCTLIGGTKKPITTGVHTTLESPSNNLKSPGRLNKGKGFRGKKDELLYKNVRVVKGKHKGKLGLVVGCTDTKVQVELQSICTTMTFDRVDVKLLDPIQSSTFNNPQFDGGQTPKQLNTPLIHSTPSHSSAWDPMQPNTPKTYETPGTDFPDDDHNSPDSYRNMDMIVSTPGFNPNNYSPGTVNSPLSVDSAKHSSTPSIGIETPPMSLDIVNPTTPSTFGTPTPNLHMSDYHQNNYPAGFDEQNEIEWVEDVICSITDKYANGSHNGSEGRIIEINHANKSMNVHLEDNQVLYDIPFDAVSLPIPQKNDQLRIVSGDQHVGATGVLVGMDESDCIVKLDEGKKICLIHLQHLRIIKRA